MSVINKLTKTIAAVLAAGIIFTSAAAAVSAKAQNSDISLGKNDFLKTRGKYIINSDGKTVQLRGTNLGGWLVHEQWMCPSDAADGSELYDTIYSRFGRQKGQELIDTYLDNWITEDDLDTIASMGLNCVRVPFWFRNFMNEDGEWKSNSCGQPDFSSLDWIIDECGRRGLYVILDMHGAPGFQSIAHHCGKTGCSMLYDKTPEGDNYRRLTVKLWTAIAARYAGNPTVAAYDLLNEPTCDMNTDEYLDRIMLIYNRLYTAVRSVDPCHMITLEAIWRLDKIKEPEYFGWTNVVYQLHIYNYNDKEIDEVISHINEYSYYNVPILVGECNAGNSYEHMLTLFNENAVSWTTWCYKGCFSGTTWFMFSADYDKTDIHTEDFYALFEKWSTGIRTENMTENTALTSIVKAAAAADTIQATETANNGFAALFKNLFMIIIRLFESWIF